MTSKAIRKIFLEIHTFKFADLVIRKAFDDKGNPYFCCKDVCRYLGISNYREAFARLHVEQKFHLSAVTNGGTQTMCFINESGFYELIFKSRKSVAQEFKYWICSNAIPKIRTISCGDELPSIFYTDLFAQKRAQ
ncbi:BRO family protein [Vibrio sp. SCSIO 43169]|uniref:BRO-N domain-containing protein n=1 Tax=Vibrio sp. SCSIO 43169 TaxID=2822801 RepID=UPI0020436519|nr:BRO family protein [Vibrio sp. SCSIO 43169]MCM5507152.1 hypothetical protein [Vibrio sp. SCSIO 43169]